MNNRVVSSNENHWILKIIVLVLTLKDQGMSFYYKFKKIPFRCKSTLLNICDYNQKFGVMNCQIYHMYLVEGPAEPVSGSSIPDIALERMCTCKLHS